MRTLTAVLGATALAATFWLTAGCGSGNETSRPEITSAPDASLFDSCRADDPALDDAAVVAHADLDGSGASNEIALVPQSTRGPCAGSLFTTFDGEPSAVSLHGAAIDRRSATVVQLSGTQQQLLMLRERAHPRGGFMVHLYAADRDGIGELLVDGRPVIGFVATDGGTAPATATCTDDGGIAVLSASTHEPPGIVLAWDVRRTTYTLHGTAAERSSTRLIREAAADPLLRKEMPQLFDPEALFTDCAAEPMG